MTELRPFQRRFLAGATRDGIDTACLSLPRGNGKSFLAARLLTRILSPGDPLWRPGQESVLCAASIEQARIVFRFVRAELEPSGRYRFLDSATRVAITHAPTNTRLRIIGSNGKTAMGLVNTPWAICDEPGAWETNGGQLLADALMTAQGKPGSPLRAVFLGTLAPAKRGWWHDLIADGSRGSTYVQSLAGNREKWDSWAEIRRCNPLTTISKAFRKKLLEERDAARHDSRLKARFLSYRLNLPSADESTELLAPADWKTVCARPVSARDGAPIVGIDLGGGRAWSAAVALWPSGRLEAIAQTPGLPALDEQETRDRVPSGLYRQLVDGGRLLVADGLRVQPPSQLIEAAKSLWGEPLVIVCDYFKLNTLRDCIGRTRVVARRTRWSEAAEDISALRKLALDGGMSCEESSRLLLTASLAVAQVVNDDAGNVRLIKSDPSNNTARDDVASALTLAAGTLSRAPKARAGGYLGLVG